MLLADMSPAQLGNWVIIAFAVFSGLGSLGGLVAFFATRREVQEIDRRTGENEKAIVDIRAEMNTSTLELIASGERRSESLHRRIDPLVENTAALKAGQEAFCKSFDNFSTIIAAQQRK